MSKETPHATTDPGEHVRVDLLPHRDNTPAFNLRSRCHSPSPITSFLPHAADYLMLSRRTKKALGLPGAIA